MKSFYASWFIDGQDEEQEGEFQAEDCNSLIAQLENDGAMDIIVIESEDEEPTVDGQPDEAQEWASFDADC